MDEEEGIFHTEERARTKDIFHYFAGTPDQI